MNKNIGIRQQYILQVLSDGQEYTKADIDEQTKELALRLRGREYRRDMYCPRYEGGYDPIFWKRDNSEVLRRLVIRELIVRVRHGVYRKA